MCIRARSDDAATVRVAGPRDAVLVWATHGDRAFSYRAPAAKSAVHAIFNIVADTATITAKRVGDDCEVEVTPGGAIPAHPAIVTLDASCTVAIDPEAARGAGTIHRGVPIDRARAPHAGCCGAQTTPESPIAMTIVVAAMLLRRRRRATSRARARCAR
jgi:hypothetical protein